MILDVVYNHTAEGNHLGPMLSFKGIDNAAYYRLIADKRRYYMDYTGTGNTLNMRHPHVLQLIMDSLRYWVIDMHVDGFRFDLAATLARELHDVDRLSAFFDIIQQDPVISQVKLIAEPWDVGEGGYQVGNFPPLWSEWNGKYRDNVRDFWRGTDQTLAEFAYRFTGSSDLYEGTARRPYASVNFITAHDGFTLRDLVSYNEKHNEANGEDSRDGESHNRSWNCGVEGPTDDPKVLALRNRQVRNFLTTLMLSQGVPMLLGGDEIGRTQNGNNNGYCQDNEIVVVRLGARRRGPAAVHPRTDPHAAPPSGILPAPVVPGTADSWHQRQRHRLVHARRHRDVGRGLAGGLCEVARCLPQRPRHSHAERARRAGRRRQLLHDVQRRATNRSSSSCPRAEVGTRWTQVLDTYESTDEMSEERRARSSTPARPCPWTPGPRAVSAAGATRGRDHDFCGFDDGKHASPRELQLVDRVPRDDGGQRLIADPQPHLGEQPFAPHFVDDAMKLVAAAECDDRPV